MQPFADGKEHLLAELGRLELLLRRQAIRLRAADPSAGDPYRGLYIPDTQAAALLRDGPVGEEPADARALTTEIARRAADNQARIALGGASHPALPLPRLAGRCGLSPFEL